MDIVNLCLSLYGYGMHNADLLNYGSWKHSRKPYQNRGCHHRPHAFQWIETPRNISCAACQQLEEDCNSISRHVHPHLRLAMPGLLKYQLHLQPLVGALRFL